MAGKHIFNIDAGATWQVTVTWTGTNLSGFSVRMFMKRNYSDTTAAVELTTANGKIAITDAANGIITLNLTAAETAALSGSYLYDLEYVNGSTVTRLLEGSVIISPEVTK